MHIFVTLMALFFAVPVMAQQYDPGRLVLGCFGGNDDGLPNLNSALDRVTEFNDMFDSESRKLLAGNCWWHSLPRYGAALQYWEGFYTRNGWIFPRWQQDILSRSADSDVYWSDELFATREWKIGYGRQCEWLVLDRFGECLIPQDRVLARSYITWKRNNGQTIPPYISIPREWMPQ